MTKPQKKTNTQKEFLGKKLKKLSIYGDVTAKFMFGGYGIYFEGMMFALVADEQIYFKTDRQSKEIFERAKQKPFIYLGKPGKPIVMSYYTIPKAAWKSATDLKIWFDLGVEAAKRNLKIK